MKVRVIDTGILTAAQNMALDEALLRAQSENPHAIPVIRFLRFSPPCVLVGRYQSPAQEARLSYIRERGWHVNRRITGGGAIFFDPSQIGWEFFARFDKGFPKNPQKLYEMISACGVAGLRKLGVRAQFRPRNDIEVDGRKISGTGGASDEHAFMFQGTLLVKNVAEDMLKALRVPAEKLGRHGLESIKERVVFLEELLSPLPEPEVLKNALLTGFTEVLGIEPIPSQLTDREREIYNELIKLFSSDEWIYKIDNPSSRKGTLTGVSRADGVVRAAAHVEVDKKLVTSVQFWGDFFVTPKRIIPDLEASLKFIPANPKKAREKVDEFFVKNKFDFIGVSPKNFADALSMAIEKIELVRRGLTFEETNNIMFANIDLRRIEDYDFEYFLFPYCSKLVGCAWRHDVDCPMCGQCSVGEGYEIALASGLKPMTITSFEHLVQTHRWLRKKGVKGYIGSCCEEFFVKHKDEFDGSGLHIILIRIDSATCYELSQAKAAYRGEFESQTELNLKLIRKTLGLIRPRKSIKAE